MGAASRAPHIRGWRFSVESRDAPFQPASEAPGMLDWTKSRLLAFPVVHDNN